MTFEPYFTLAEVQARLPFTLSVLRAKVKRGEFSPPGPSGAPDLSNILFDGVLLVPLSGLEHYRRTHSCYLADGPLVDVVRDRMRPPAPLRPEVSPPVVVARSPGEALRKARGKLPASVDAAAVVGKNGQPE